ncbi:ciliated left-right organizer metallopeptidase-like [Tachypleus tridentatus]|uniref:ciliated left-right organizer metallopeptidase-like n=1 Tax=Tachypleus tridentatus TaxID=6853 RepID=UPI003FD156A2
MIICHSKKWFVVFSCLSVVQLSHASYCIHDELHNNINLIPRTKLLYSSRTKLSKRETTNQYQPIRIHLHHRKLASDLSPTGKTNLLSVMRKAVQRIQHLLLVVPVQEPLLLQRNKACGSKWTSGPNRNKCAEIKHGYMGEFCENQIDKMQIPEEHLEKVLVYNFSGPAPLPSSLPAGPGVKDSDYLLYINSMYSEWCQKEEILAYASYCQLDQFDRPVAGYINFCPAHFDDTTYNEEKLVLTAIHELIHALGFSQDLRSNFRDCSDTALRDRQCPLWKRTVVMDLFGVPRVVLPSVVNFTKQHYNCGMTDFGAPLEKMPDGSGGSHWDPVMMYGSMMTPKIGEPGFVSLDAMTAALLADSGWYKVNFTAVDSYIWGKDQGCQFGLPSSCSSTSVQSHTSLLCDPSSVHEGCDFLHHTVTTCQKISPSHECGIFKPNITQTCSAYETSSQRKACFLLTTGGKRLPSCLQYNCINSSVMEVYVGDTTVTCWNNSAVEIKEKILKCPPLNILCQTLKHHHFSITKSSDPASSVIETELYFPDKEVMLEVIFSKPTQHDIIQNGVPLKNFKVAAVKKDLEFNPSS